jgi:hypothetical protein
MQKTLGCLAILMLTLFVSDPVRDLGVAGDDISKPRAQGAGCEWGRQNVSITALSIV